MLTSTQNRSIPYEPGLDGLRALAITAVFIFHLNPDWLPGGFIGVDIFFVLSGYLITRILYQQHKDGKVNILTEFYHHRIARIFPALLFTILVVMVVAWLIYLPQDLAASGAVAAATAASLANIKFLFQGNYFELTADTQPFLHCWSLSLEEQFYVLFPAAFLLILRTTTGTRYIRIWIALTFLLSLTLCIVLTEWKSSWAFYLLPSRSWELLAGALLALVHKERLNNQWLNKFGLETGLLTIAASIFLISESMHFPGVLALFPVGGAVLMIASLRHSSSPLLPVLTCPPLVYLGCISYSLYLWHWPIFSFTDYRLWFIPTEQRLVIKILLSLALGIASYHLIEQKARVFLRRRTSFSYSLPAAITASLILFFAGVLLRNHNYPDVTQKELRSGGLVITPHSPEHSMVLIGDSNAAMYAKTFKELASSLNMQLTLAGIPGGNPVGPSPLWDEYVRLISTHKPDIVVYISAWSGHLTDFDSMTHSINELMQYTDHVVIIEEPPQLPPNAHRSQLRISGPTPIYESTGSANRRNAIHEYFSDVAIEGFEHLSVDDFFLNPEGDILVYDQHYRFLYHDLTHLSGLGVSRVKKHINQTLKELLLNP